MLRAAAIGGECLVQGVQRWWNNWPFSVWRAGLVWLRRMMKLRAHSLQTSSVLHLIMPPHKHGCVTCMAGQRAGGATHSKGVLALKVFSSAPPTRDILRSLAHVKHLKCSCRGPRAAPRREPFCYFPSWLGRSIRDRCYSLHTRSDWRISAATLAKKYLTLLWSEIKRVKDSHCWLEKWWWIGKDMLTYSSNWSSECLFYIRLFPLWISNEPYFKSVYDM